MKNKKTPTKTVRVRRTSGIVFYAPPTKPDALGYVVRYANGDPKGRGGPSNPLRRELNGIEGYEAGVLLINNGDGTIFPTYELACDAVIKSIDFQKAHNCHWNRMYGDYLISPVVAR